MNVKLLLKRTVCSILMLMVISSASSLSPANTLFDFSSLNKSGVSVDVQALDAVPDSSMQEPHHFSHYNFDVAYEGSVGEHDCCEAENDCESQCCTTASMTLSVLTTSMVVKPLASYVYRRADPHFLSSSLYRPPITL